MTIWYVNQSTGNDDNDGLSEDSPLASEGEALERAARPWEYWVLVGNRDKWENVNRYLETAGAQGRIDVLGEASNG